MFRFHFKFFLIFVFFSHYNFIHTSQPTKWWQVYRTEQKFNCTCKACGEKVLLKITKRLGKDDRYYRCLETSSARWHKEVCKKFPRRATIKSANISRYFNISTVPSQPSAIPATEVQLVDPIGPQQYNHYFDPMHFSVRLIDKDELPYPSAMDIDLSSF